MRNTVSFISHTITHEDSVLDMVKIVREGINYKVFMQIADTSQFSIPEWSTFLHVSERTMQRYQKQKKVFDSLQSEKILEIAQLYNKGVEVFNDKDNFKSWLETKNLALGGVKPKNLLDTSFGIGMVKDELIRIEYGVLA
jgi:putative toxin-antitoxin system antitoxin component (TIGR02293 family)